MVEMIYSDEYTLFEIEKFIEKKQGMRDKVNVGRKQIVFATVTNIDSENKKIFFNIQIYSFDIELEKNKIDHNQLTTEKEMLTKIHSYKNDFKNPLIVKISPRTNYTKHINPLFPPEIVS
jgi:hypothetical protein